MTPLETFTLKAFLVALSQLDAPLPAEVQTQVKQIRIPEDIDKLDAIARDYPPLAESYNKVRKALRAIAKEHNKGNDFLPDPEPEESNIEIDNSTREIGEPLLEFDKQVDDKLTEIARKIIKAPNPVQSAKDIIMSIPRLLADSLAYE